MFLSESAQARIADIRDENKGGVNVYKSQISDAVEVVMNMYQMHAVASEKSELMEVVSVLTDYNRLLTELAKER